MGLVFSTEVWLSSGQPWAILSGLLFKLLHLDLSRQLPLQIALLTKRRAEHGARIIIIIIIVNHHPHHHQQEDGQRMAPGLSSSSS